MTTLLHIALHPQSSPLMTHDDIFSPSTAPCSPALQDDYPTVHRFATSVFPSQDDDVVTSPYNALLSLSRLARHADCAFPLENQALLDICSAVEAKGRRGLTRAGSAVTGAGALAVVVCLARGVLRCWLGWRPRARAGGGLLWPEICSQ